MSDSQWIQTFSKKRFYPLDPKKQDVDISDIAHALSLKCRFGCMSERFYSVAQHSVLASKHVRVWEADVPHADLRLGALLHDGGEAYLPDVPGPYKDYVFFLIGDAYVSFKDQEHLILKTVILPCLSLPVDLTDHTEVHHVDRALLAWESQWLMGGECARKNREPSWIMNIEEERSWSPEESEHAFMLRYHELQLLRRDHELSKVKHRLKACAELVEIDTDAGRAFVHETLRMAE